MRRNRWTATSTGKRVEINEADTIGLFEPLSRYGRLPTSRLMKFDPRSQNTRKRRLKDIFHETEKWPLADKPILRSEETWAFGGMNGEAQYMEGRGARRYLDRSNFTEVPKIGPSEKSDHDFILCITVADIELHSPTFINQRAILREAPSKTRELDNPFRVPVDRITWNGSSLGDTCIEPDALFGLASGFYALELDMGTETVAPKSDLTKSSWLRKILSYERANFGKHLGLPEPKVLCVFQTEDRMQWVMRKAVLDVIGPSERYLFNVYKPVQKFKKIAPSTDYLTTSLWQRAGLPPVTIGESNARSQNSSRNRADSEAQRHQPGA